MHSDLNSSQMTLSIETLPTTDSPEEAATKKRREKCHRQRNSKRHHHRPVQDSSESTPLTLQGLNDMIDQIRRCESILSDGLGVKGNNEQLSERLLAKVNRLTSLRLRHCPPQSVTALDQNNNKCCNGARSSNAVSTDAQNLDTTGHGENTESESEGDVQLDESDAKKRAFPKHQDYCLCHKRKCQRCGCLCPCSEHACPSCGYTSRAVLTMRAVEGLREIAHAQKSRYRNGRMSLMPKCKSSHKRFLLNDSGNECSHAVMVRVGGGFVPLVEYLKSHNKVVLSKFTREDGSAFLSPWRPYYAGPLKKGRPRGIRYVDSVTQQLEEIIFANREAGKIHCTCA